MCKAKSEPNYYRCEWSKQSTSQFFGKLVDAGAEVTISMVVAGVDPTTEAGWAKLSKEAREQVASGVAEVLGSGSSAAHRKKTAKEFKRPIAHLLCAVAAAIGEACVSLSGATADLAQAIGDEVAQRTGSVIAGKVAKRATSKLIEMAVPQAALLPQVGFLADSAAVGICPSQQRGGEVANHPEVQRCAHRLERKLVTEMVEALYESEVP